MFNLEALLDTPALYFVIFAVALLIGTIMSADSGSKKTKGKK